MDETNPSTNEETIGKIKHELESARLSNDPKLVCASLEKLGQAYLDQYQAPDALSQFEEALKNIKDLDDKESEARLLGEKGLALKMLGNGSLALQSFRKSKSLATDIDHKSLLCDSEFQIGLILFEKEKQAEGLEEMSRALGIATDLQDVKRKMRIAGTLAEHYQVISKPDLSEKYYRLAHEMAQITGNRNAECTFLTRLGNLSLSSDRLNDAVDQYERSLSIASELKNRNAEINILSGLFRANALAKNLDQAANYGEKVIQLSDEIQHYEAEIDNINVLAMFLVDEGKYEKAQTYLDRGIALAEKENSQDWLLALETTRGTAFYRSGNNQAARQSYEHAASIASMISDRRSEARALSYLSGVQADDGDIAQSALSAEKALLLARQLEDKSLEAESQMLLAFNYRDQNKPADAVRACQAAIDAYQEMGNDSMIEKAEELMEQLQG